MKKLFILTVTALLIVCSFSACKGNARQDVKKNNIIIKEESSVESSPSIDTNTYSDVSSTTECKDVFKDEEVEEELEEVKEELEEVEKEKDEATVELVGVNKLRPDYDLGTCKDLSGNVTVVIFYLNDFESSWTSEKINKFTEREVKPGLRFLENSALKFGINLSIKIEEIHSDIYYEDEVETNIKESGYATINALDAAAKSLGYSSDQDFINSYKKKYSTEVICYCVFNKEGNSYALNPKRGTDIDIEEHVLLFAYDIGSTGLEPVGCQSSVVAHETLHLYGAEDYYNPEERKTLAKEYYPNDIMLSCKYFLSLNDFGDITAFYVGWIDDVPNLLFEETW
ncbi:MAG: hypothetical protein J6B80_06325 [Clostridia bacterium]|nr:hypothetical protein [Clostridia bacterium]